MMSGAEFLLLIALGQVAAEAAPSFAPDEIDYFEKKVRPILVERCYECHSAKAKRVEAEFYVDRREAIIAGGESGPAATPGDPEISRLVSAVRYSNENLQMPPDGKIPDEEIAILTEWVKRGLPFPKTETVAATKRKIDIEAGRKHWAFQPVSLHEAPVRDEWIQQKVDAFVLARLRDVGRSTAPSHAVTPSSPASREVLIRRAKFDLLGLPPAPDEIAEFASDASPDAYPRLIDRYLASPHYGERWGRFWLDLARYCDVPEEWRGAEAQAWLYRDWVVRAINDDLPYDNFVRQQLAADLLPDARPEDNAALGFLGLSPTYWKELKLDHNVIKQVVAEEWEEQIEAVGATFLGLTAACARCHDHKFDPITQHDYYALAGVLASIRLEDRPIIAADLAEPAKNARAKAKEIQKQLDELAKVKEPTDEQKQQLAALPAQLDELRRTPHFNTPLAYGVSEASIVVSPDGEHRTKIDYKPGEAQNVAVHIRGMASNSGPMVPRRFLTVFTSAEKPFVQGSGRRELAESIVGDAAPLAARVIVNRVWRHHFGRGLVNTPSNFGTQGEKSSHPELLHDLAARFIANGWSLKWLHRELMLSATYQQASRRDQGKYAIDPDNILLWRMTPRKLDVEAWRDAALVAAGELDAALGRDPLDLADANNRRRTLYGRVKRRELTELLRLHDFPDPVGHSAAREGTITPLQQLFAINAPFLHQRSAALVARLEREAPTEPDKRIVWLYPQLFGRAATADEVAAGQQFLTDAENSSTAPGEAWREYCHALLTCNEFLFVD
jgi:hypothetical protein